VTLVIVGGSSEPELDEAVGVFVDSGFQLARWLSAWDDADAVLVSDIYAAGESPIEGVVISPDAYSRGEVLRHREFDRMTPAELREAERLVDALVPSM